MWKDIPWMGIGQRWDGESDLQRLQYLGDGIDFIEPSLPVSLDLLPKDISMITHSSELAIASSGSLNRQMVNCIRDQIEIINPPWTGEHFCLVSSIETGELGYNFSPILNKDTLDASIHNIDFLQQIYKVPILIECGPRYFSFDGKWDDHGMMLDVAKATDCGILLDLSHHLVSTSNLGKSSTDGLSIDLLERTIEIHVTGVGQHHKSGYFHDCHSVPIPEVCWSLLDWVLERTPLLKAVTLEHNYKVSRRDYERDLRLLQHKIFKRRFAYDSVLS